jgi:hypothetical protein
MLEGHRVLRKTLRAARPAKTRCDLTKAEFRWDGVIATRQTIGVHRTVYHEEGASCARSAKVRHSWTRHASLRIPSYRNLVFGGLRALQPVDPVLKSGELIMI